MGGDIGSDGFSLPSGWSTKSLIECTSDKIISYGIVQPGTDCLEGIPIVRVNNFSAGYLDGTDHLRVDPSIETKFSRTRLKGGEVLLTLVGSTGQSAIVPKEMAGWNVARAIAVIRASSDIGANWIELCLNSRETKHFLDSRANTTVQKTLNLKDVRNIPIRIPPEPVRLGIEKISIALNRKIELNRQTNETLEAMAQAMFKSWFVDFDPVIDNALAAGNDIPEPFQARAAARLALGDARQPLPEEIRCEFPDEFVFSDEMGWVPRRWECGTLNDLAIKVTDGSHSSPPSVLPEEGLPMASSKDLTSNGIRLGSCRYVSSKDFDSLVANGCSPIHGDVLIAKDGSRCGETCCVFYGKSNVVLLSSVAIIRPKIPEYSTYLDTLLSRDETIAELRENYVSGSAIPRIVLRDLKRYPLIIASENVMELWSGQIDSLHQKRLKNVAEASELEIIRNTLLPKLLSGQLTIPNAEKLVAEAL